MTYILLLLFILAGGVLFWIGLAIFLNGNAITKNEENINILNSRTDYLEDKIFPIQNEIRDLWAKEYNDISSQKPEP